MRQTEIAVDRQIEDRQIDIDRGMIKIIDISRWLDREYRQTQIGYTQIEQIGIDR